MESAFENSDAEDELNGKAAAELLYGKGFVYDPEHGKYLPSFLNDDEEDDGLYDGLVDDPCIRDKG